MKVRRSVYGVLGLALTALTAPHAHGAWFEQDLRETPSLIGEVRAQRLPPVKNRIPERPLIVSLAVGGAQYGLSAGRHGGELRTLIATPRDMRYMVVYGYARLVGRNRALALVPDILEKVDVEEDRIFTLHLRPGHKWSDGRLFTTEDFRYYWEDVANNPKLSPGGLEPELLAGGVGPQVEIIDPLTVRYSWPVPNPGFLPQQAQARPAFIYRPAHYLKQFHFRYANPSLLAGHIAKAKVRGWAALHNRKDSMYDFDNPEMPTLQPWVNTTTSPSARYIFERNPYYHRIDENGRQLPYIDRVVMNLTDSRLIAAKANAGETDLQARGLAFSDVAVLRQGEARNDYVTRLWPIATGSHLALYPNLNFERPGWRALLRDARFRRALSLAIDRHMINRSLYFGIASEGNNTVLPGSPLFEDAYRSRWADFDPALASKLLDEIGLTARRADGIRLMADGTALELIIEIADESSEQSDILQMIETDWRRIGVKLFIKPSTREVMRNRVYSGRAMMTAWSGLDTGIPTADMAPIELAPMAQDQLQWPRWGQYYQTAGNSGEAPDIPEAVALLELGVAWPLSGAADRRQIWKQMLSIHADQLFSIGTIAQVRQPVVVSKQLRNVPDEAFYGWNPGAHFGLYRPDQFWFDDAPVAPEHAANEKGLQ